MKGHRSSCHGPKMEAGLEVQKGPLLPGKELELRGELGLSLYVSCLW